jgi:hypothetical protein
VQLKKLQNARAWVEALDDEDLSFIRRFLLASGSLKEVAALYGISYPTVRLRLDRLIEKVKLLSAESVQSEFERTIRIEYAQGKMDLGTLNRLLGAHRREMEGRS